MFIQLSLVSAILTCYGCLGENVMIDTNQVVFDVRPDFLSVGIPCAMIADDFHPIIHTESDQLFTLCDAFGKKNGQNRTTLLRIGAASCDNMTYKAEGLDFLQSDGRHQGRQYVLNNTEWDEINAFVKRLGNWRIVFGLSIKTRTHDGQWDSTSASQFIKYSQSQGYDVDFELGNEPDLFYEYEPFVVSPTQLAKDFKTLSELLLRDSKGRSSVIGPDVATIHRLNYFPKFLQSVEPNVLDAVTFHHYYGASKTATAEDFINPQYQDTLIDRLNGGIGLVRSANGTHSTEIWLGETSSTYGGGAKGLSDAYVAGFLWMDKLGIAARMGVSLLMRWNLVKGRYALIGTSLNPLTYTPLPDYWLSLLYKQLVGQRVLDVRHGLEKNRTLRAYAHCMCPYNRMGYSATAVTVMAINDNKDTPASLSFGRDLQGLDVDVYLLTPVHNDLHSQDVELNGEVLRMIDRTTMPTLKPVRRSQPVVIPPLTFGFFVIPDADATACQRV